MNCTNICFQKIRNKEKTTSIKNATRYTYGRIRGNASVFSFMK